MNTEQQIIQVSIEDIIPNRFQPRLSFDESGLKELSESIKQHGIIQPLVLRRLGNKYEIIAGERRFKASTMAGLKTVPAIISNIDDNKSAEVALVENIQRRNLTAIEEAKSYKNLLDRGYMTQEQLAAKMGVSQSAIANKLRLLNLAPEVQDALLKEKISERHARSLLAVPKEEQKEWLKKIISKRMTVRQLDLEIKKSKGEVEESIPLVNPNQNLETKVNNSITTPKDQTSSENNQNEINIAQNNSIPNKFFNFLEDEAANMNMEIPVSNETITSPENSNEIEVLDDFDITQIPTAPKEEPKINQEDDIMPFFFSQPTPQANKNQIEEIRQTSKEQIIDPIDAIAKLDPNYAKEQQKAAGMDLKTAIGDVRNLINIMTEKGFQISLDEIDLADTYQMTINIKKND